MLLSLPDFEAPSNGQVHNREMCFLFWYLAKEPHLQKNSLFLLSTSVKAGLPELSISRISVACRAASNLQAAWQKEHSNKL